MASFCWSSFLEVAARLVLHVFRLVVQDCRSFAQVVEEAFCRAGRRGCTCIEVWAWSGALIVALCYMAGTARQIKAFPDPASGQHPVFTGLAGWTVRVKGGTTTQGL